MSDRLVDPAERLMTQTAVLIDPGAAPGYFVLLTQNYYVKMWWDQIPECIRIKGSPPFESESKINNMKYSK